MNGRRAVWITCVTLATALAVAACGRSTSMQVGGDGWEHPYPDAGPPPDGRPPVPDTWTPPPDGLILPDGIGPPPPDGWLPPPDGWIPPTDGWPPPWDGWIPPPMDGWPPLPDVGPCTVTCSQMCQVLIPCGLYQGTYGQCISACQSWPASQTSCLSKLICAGTSSCMTFGTCLAPQQKPDLLISSFSASVSGNTVTYTIQACNKGQAAAGGFFVDVYYNRSSAPGQKEFGDQYKQYSSLAAGACVTATFTRSNTPAGTYSSWAQVDADGIVSESNESNNISGPIKVTVSGTPPPGPDLVITNITTSIYGYTTATVRYRFTVCNSGTSASAATQVHVYYNLSAPPKQGTNGDKYTTVPALATGACTTRDIYRYQVPAGTYSSYGQVDPANTVSESNESNNVYGPEKVTVGTAQGADLVIQTFTYQAYAYSTVLYSIQVCNTGTGSSGSTQVHVYYHRSTAPAQGQSGDKTAQVPILAAGQCANRYVIRPNTPNGTYSSWAYVDPLNTVTETSESNNVKGPITVQVGSPITKPDLYFKSFSASVSGTNIYYSAVVCNQGNAASTPFRVDIYYNRQTAPTTGQYGDTAALVPTLAVSGCITISRTYAATAGSYKSWAQVDTSSWVSESNENNNVYGPVNVTVSTTVTCTTLCAFATSCGIFTPAQALQCLAWCQGLSTTARQCANAAYAAASCTALKNCNLPPPPPPPPPPGVCADMCTWLINTCKLLPSNQYWTCYGACQNLTPSKIQCAQTAKKNNQCYQALLCII